MPTINYIGGEGGKREDWVHADGSVITESEWAEIQNSGWVKFGGDAPMTPAPQTPNDQWIIDAAEEIDAEQVAALKYVMKKYRIAFDPKGFDDEAGEGAKAIAAIIASHFHASGGK